MRAITKCLVRDFQRVTWPAITLHQLKPHAKVWYHFLKFRLMPFTHVQTISRDRMLLLFSILNEKSINVGNIIVEEIRYCAPRNSGSLFFPSLITQLCLKAGVPVSSEEERICNKGAITAQTIARICLEGPTRRGRDRSAAQADPEPEPVAPSVAAGNATASANAAAAMPAEPI